MRTQVFYLKYKQNLCTWRLSSLWRRKWHPIPVFLPGESHGRRSLVGYSPRGRKESDTTERLHFLYGKMQGSGLTKIDHFLYMAAFWGQYLVVFHTLPPPTPSSSTATVGSGCSLVGVRIIGIVLSGCPPEITLNLKKSCPQLPPLQTPKCRGACVY